MTVGAAIAPVAGYDRRQRASRMIVVGVAYVAVVAAGAIYPFVSPLRDFWNALPPPEIAANALGGLVWLPILLVAIARQPNGRLWKLIFLLAVTWRIDALEYVPNSVVFTLARASDVAALAVFVHLIVSFPSGELRGRFDRGVVAYGYLLVIVWTLKEIVFAGDWWEIGCNPECIRNAFVIWPNPELYEWLRNAIALPATTTFFPLVIVAIWRHWRGATDPARRMLLPLIVGIPTWLVIGQVEILGRELDWDSAVAFFDSPPGMVIHFATPLIFPVGVLIALVGIRYGRARIAGLIVELGRGVPVGGLRDVLARAIGDPTLELAFAAPTGSGFVDSSGRPVELPASDPSRMVTRLERGGEVLGVLVHDPQVEAEDPGFVEAVGNAARLALENERLAAEVRAQLAEVRASRVRIVEAADGERRRVERDLHDGAQQRLVALALRLQVAKNTAPDAARLLDEATNELETAIAEVRGLARGVHPTILTEAGLRAAVEALADRTLIPIAVDVVDLRYDPRVEAAAYFVAAEALTNIARHADATEATVSIAERSDRLVVTIADDGVGGASVGAGSGLLGLRDRVAAIDGHLSVESPVGAGTTVTAEIPLEVVSPAPVLQSATPGTPLASDQPLHEAPAEGLRPGRRVLSNPVVLSVAASAMVGVMATAAWFAAVQPQPPVLGRTESFLAPFDYQLPGDREFRLGPRTERLFGLRTIGGGDGSGISVWAVGAEVPLSPCGWRDGSTNQLRRREPGVQGLLAYLRSVDHLDVTETGSVLVDNRPGMRVKLSVASAETGCPNGDALGLWHDLWPGGATAMVWVGSYKEVSLLDLDGETIAIEVWSADDPGMDPWLPTAHSIIDSIRFLNAAPARSPGTPRPAAT